MNKLLIAIIISTLLGCASRNNIQELSISTGMDYSKAKIRLNSKGMKETTTACWDMMPPDNVILHTYFINNNEALIIEEDKKTGLILSMSIYGNTNKPKFYGTHKDISKYVIK